MNFAHSAAAPGGDTCKQFAAPSLGAQAYLPASLSALLEQCSRRQRCPRFVVSLVSLLLWAGARPASTKRLHSVFRPLTRAYKGAHYAKLPKIGVGSASHFSAF